MAPIVEFAADRDVIRPGEWATIRWHVEGVQAVYFFPEGERWKEHGVVGVGEQQVCPSQTTTYCLRVLRRNDEVVVKKLAIQVQAEAEAAVSQMFAVDRAAIPPGEWVTFRWQVEGVKAVYFYAEGEPWQGHGVAGVAEQQICLGQTTTMCLRVVKPDDAVEVHYLTVEVG